MPNPSMIYLFLSLDEIKSEVIMQNMNIIWWQNFNGVDYQIVSHVTLIHLKGQKGPNVEGGLHCVVPNY